MATVVPSSVSPVVVLGLLFALAAKGAHAAGSSPEDSVVDDNLQVTTTSTSSTNYATCDITWLEGCEFDVVLPEGGSFNDLLVEIESLDDSIYGHDIYCSIAKSGDPRLEGARLSEADSGDGFDYLVEGVSQELPAGIPLLSCRAEIYSTMCAWDRYDFRSVQAFSETPRGEPTGRPDAPRTCIASFECDGETVYSLPEPQCGDANWDLRVTAGDALAALRTSIGLSSCRFASSCDANGDRRVGADDALIILRAVVQASVGLVCPLPCIENWTFDVVIEVGSLPIPPAYYHLVSLVGGRFHPHPDWDWGDRTTIREDGSAILEAEWWDESLAVTFSINGVRPHVSDFDIVAVGDDGSMIEGAIKSVRVEFTGRD